MAKIVIWDTNTERFKEYKVRLANIDGSKLKVSMSADDLENCKLFFRHASDSIDEIESDSRYLNSIKIEFSGEGLTAEITKETFPYEATIKSPSDIFRVLDILDNDSFTLNDVNYILGFDSKLEKLLERFAPISPFTPLDKNLENAKAELQTYVEKYLKEQSK